MKEFSQLIKKLDETNKTTLKVEALVAYFQTVSDDDKVWTIAMFSHRRPSRPVNTKLLRLWASELANIPIWLFEESYHIVGDLAETIALVVEQKYPETNKTLSSFLGDLLELKSKTDTEKKAYLYHHWQRLDYYGRFVFTKLITGGFRIGLSQKLMIKALSKATGIDQDILAYKLMGHWNPAEISFKELILEERKADVLSKPYPFYLAYPLEDQLVQLGNINDWAVEHKWDGIRAQVIIRNDTLFVWTRGEELVTDKFPEFYSFVGHLPNGTVLDGEILPFANYKIGTFNDLQSRIGRKTIPKKLLERTPVILKAYDLLEWGGKDLRSESYLTRRRFLEQLISSTNNPLVAMPNKEDIPLQISDRLQFDSWAEVAQERKRARAKQSEGLMLKRLNATYQVGRKRGDWWKWKIDPLTIDAVLTYAMRGHGRRTNLFTDYTFALWDINEIGEKALVTFAKAYSGLTDKEFKTLDAWIKKNTLERYGPVRSVIPHHVFEIAFEGVALSKRHKSGVATRFPRILRWRQDKTIEDANTLTDLKKMIG